MFHWQSEPLHLNIERRSIGDDIFYITSTGSWPGIFHWTRRRHFPVTMNCALWPHACGHCTSPQQSVFIEAHKIDPRDGAPNFRVGHLQHESNGCTTRHIREPRPEIEPLAAADAVAAGRQCRRGCRLTTAPSAAHERVESVIERCLDMHRTRRPAASALASPLAVASRQCKVVQTGDFEYANSVLHSKTGEGDRAARGSCRMCGTCRCFRLRVWQLSHCGCLCWCHWRRLLSILVILGRVGHGVARRVCVVVHFCIAVRGMTLVYTVVMAAAVAAAAACGLLHVLVMLRIECIGIGTEECTSVPDELKGDVFVFRNGIVYELERAHDSFASTTDACVEEGVAVGDAQGEGRVGLARISGHLVGREELVAELMDAVTGIEGQREVHVASFEGAAGLDIFHSFAGEELLEHVRCCNGIRTNVLGDARESCGRVDALERMEPRNAVGRRFQTEEGLDVEHCASPLFLFALQAVGVRGTDKLALDGMSPRCGTHDASKISQRGSFSCRRCKYLVIVVTIVVVMAATAPEHEIKVTRFPARTVHLCKETSHDHSTFEMSFRFERGDATAGKTAVEADNSLRPRRASRMRSQCSSSWAGHPRPTPFGDDETEPSLRVFIGFGEEGVFASMWPTAHQFDEDATAVMLSPEPDILDRLETDDAQRRWQCCERCRRWLVVFESGTAREPEETELERFDAAWRLFAQEARVDDAYRRV